MVASQGATTQPTGATRPLVHARAPAWAVESEPLTRLETRTKESNVCVSLVVSKNYEAKGNRRWRLASLRGERGFFGGCRHPRGMMVDPIIHHKHTRWDPKDGELCLSRVKPGETLVEARSDADVQIAHLTWV